MHYSLLKLNSNRLINVKILIIDLREWVWMNWEMEVIYLQKCCIKLYVNSGIIEDENLHTYTQVCKNITLCNKL